MMLISAKAKPWCASLPMAKKIDRNQQKTPASLRSELTSWGVPCPDEFKVSSRKPASGWKTLRLNPTSGTC